MSQKPRSQQSVQHGFTLIEMAMVLVIIGLILGAVSIGKDLQRNAEYTKVKQKFVDQWAQAYNQYYEKTGVVLADSQIAPTMAVNAVSLGEATNAFHVHGIANYISVADLPPRLCQGVDISGNAIASLSDPGMDDGRDVDNDLHFYFDSEGIEMPPGRSEGREDRYVYLDTNGNPQEIQVCFQWNPPETPSNAGNVMVIKGLTPDLARMLDQMIDGKADAREGQFRQQGIGNTATSIAVSLAPSAAAGGGVPGTPGSEWHRVNSQNFQDNATARNWDEDQVITITAHYKMNQ